MKALFITTGTNETLNHIAAWDSIASEPATIEVFNHMGISNDWRFTKVASEVKPGVIFYIGSCNGQGLPKFSTLRSLREYAPVISLVSDAEDKPWHAALERYKSEMCFDLQVSIDGGAHPALDLVTLTPVDPALFQVPAKSRDIRFGFSGNVGGARSELLTELSSNGHLMIRLRAHGAMGYPEHVKFLMRCRSTINISSTGSELKYHIKGRVLEAGWGGVALFEDRLSPIERWFPEDCFIKYETAQDVVKQLNRLSKSNFKELGHNLREVVQKKYHPSMIYGEMLDRVGLSL